MLQSPAIRIPGFTNFAWATLVSEAGNAVSWIALPIFVYQLTRSSLWTAAVAVANAAPYLVLGLFAGAIADRHSRVRLMVLANSVSGLALATIPITFRFGMLTAWQVVIISAISQSAFVFYDSSNFGYLMSLVGRERLLAANGFLFSMTGALETAAPALVGLLLGHIQVVYIIGFDAVSFLISAILLWLIRLVPVGLPDKQPSQGVFHGVVEGISYFRQNKLVGRATLISALMTAVNGGVMSVLIVWIGQAFGVGLHDVRVGIFYTAFAAAGIAAGKLAEIAGSRWTAIGALKVMIPLSAILGYVMLVMPVWWLGVLFLALSSGLGLSSVVLAVTIRQRAIPDHLQSRVNGLGRMIAFGLGYSVGALIAGGLAQAVPIGVALAILFLLRVSAAGVSFVPIRETIDTPKALVSDASIA